MAFDYASLRDMADELLAEMGQAAAIRRRTEVASGDAWRPTYTTKDYLCTVAIVDYDAREVDGSLIEQHDKRALIAAGTLSITPDAGDQLILASGAYAIINLSPLAPAGLAVVYDAQVRA